MQTIITKYIGPTDHKPSRAKATASCGITATVSFDYNDRTIDEHIRAIRAVCAKTGWTGEMIIGGHGEDGYVAVFSNDERIIL